MSADLTRERFEPHVGQRFTVRVPGGGDEHEFELVEALDLSDKMRLPEGFRAPFRLSFRGPPGLVLGQATYEIAHPDVGCHALFVVPVLAPLDQGRQLYEVIVA